MKKKKNELKDEYMKERKRIQNYVNRRKREGWLSSFKMPKIPKRIKKESINKLKNITPDYLKKKENVVVDYVTGEFFRSRNHKKLETAKKGFLKNPFLQRKTTNTILELPEETIKTLPIPKKSSILFNNFKNSISDLPIRFQRGFLDTLKNSLNSDDKNKVINYLNDILESGDLSIKEYYAIASYRNSLVEFFPTIDDEFKNDFINYMEGVTYNEDMVF